MGFSLVSLHIFIYFVIYFVAIQVCIWVGLFSYIPSFLVMLLDSLDLMDFVLGLLALHAKARKDIVFRFNIKYNRLRDFGH
jgi:hypothetical protein